MTYQPETRGGAGNGEQGRPGGEQAPLLGDGLPRFEDLLGSAPRNWGRWGLEDEIGAVNLLTHEDVLRAARSIQEGSVFALGTPIGGDEGEPVWPGRPQSQRLNVRDRASYTCGRVDPFPGGFEYAEDVLTVYTHGSTHVDAIGHGWYGGEIYNGYSADRTIDAMNVAGVSEIAKRGIIGRGILVDVARYKQKAHLGRGEAFTLGDVVAAAGSQGTKIRPHDILLLRTGWLSLFYNDRSAFYEEPFLEPGLLYEEDVPEWFRKNEITAFGTDTIANEIQPQPGTGVMSVLHAALLRNLGIPFIEILWLEDLARACADARRWEFMFIASPLRIVGGTASPVNPLAVR